MEFRYHTDSRGYDYYIPSDREEDFLYYQQKINRMEYYETKRGYQVAFDTQFHQYRKQFRGGSLWYKRNDSKGTLVSIRRVKEGFIQYQKVFLIWKFYIPWGVKYILNKWSFLRIFEEVL